MTTYQLVGSFLLVSPVKQPSETRAKILETALELFHSGSFTGTSINQIVDKCGVTKGAIFHHFKSKNELGYAIIDELFMQEVTETWIKPLEGSTDPIADMQGVMNRMVELCIEDPEVVKNGCPINNLAQEMSSIEEAFRLKLQQVYDTWQGAIERAILAGIGAGTVRPDADAAGVAASFVAFCEGCAGLLKVHRDTDRLQHYEHGVTVFLESLRP